MIGASAEDIRLEGILKVVDIEQMGNLINTGKPSKADYVNADTNQTKVEPEKLVDGDPTTLWETTKKITSLDFELKNNVNSNQITVLWKNAPNTFEIQWSAGGGQFTTLYKGEVSGSPRSGHTYNFEGMPAPVLRLIVNTDKDYGKVVIKDAEVKGFKGD